MNALRLRAVVRLAALLSLSMPEGAQQPTVITFEELETTGWGTGGQLVIERQYENAGVTFNRPILLDYGQGRFARPGFAHSGGKVLQHCYGAEFCFTPFELRFAQPQSRVKVWAGPSDANGAPFRVRMQAFDAAGVELGRWIETVPAGAGRPAVATPLEIALPLPEIALVTVRIEEEGPEASNLSLDDVEFDAAVRVSDLAIQSLARSTEDATRIEATVVNEGGVPSPATTLRLEEDGRTLAQAGIPSLAPGQSVVVALTVDPPAAGTHRWLARVDPDGLVPEVEENDNTAELAFEVPRKLWTPVLVGAAVLVAAAAGTTGYRTVRRRRLRIERARLSTAPRIDPGRQELETHGATGPHVSVRVRAGAPAISLEEPRAAVTRP